MSMALVLPLVGMLILVEHFHEDVTNIDLSVGIITAQAGVRY